jgi:integrase
MLFGFLPKSEMYLRKHEQNIMGKNSMPKYYIEKEQFYIIPLEQLKRMIKSTDDIRMRAVLAIVWITGARIGEVLMLEKKNFTLDLAHNRILIFLHTLKGGVDRELKISLNTPTVKEIILPYLDRKENKLFDIGERRVQQLLLKINKETDLWLTFHQFRHGRVSYLARTKRASMAELMDWFGWKGTKEIGTYLIRESSERLEDEIR